MKRIYSIPQVDIVCLNLKGIVLETTPIGNQSETAGGSQISEGDANFSQFDTQESDVFRPNASSLWDD